MISLEDFVSDFADQFENTDKQAITASTCYKELEEWDSLSVLTIISMINTKYNVELLGSDIRHAKDVEELYNTLLGKIRK